MGLVSGRSWGSMSEGSWTEPPTLRFPGNSAGKESACNTGDPSSILGSGRSVGEEIGYPTYTSILGLPWWLSWQRNHLQCGRPEFDPWVGNISWRREGYLLQYSGQENSMDCIVHGVVKSRTRPSDFHFHFFSYPEPKTANQVPPAIV